MRKEIYDRELIEKHQGENGWILGCFAPEKFLNDNSTDVKQISVLVSLKSNHVTVAQRRYWRDSNRWHYSRELGESIVAWQPLPSPYRSKV